MTNGIPSTAPLADGLISVRSHNDQAVTLQRLEHALRERAMTVHARIDHAAAAANVGLQMRPAEVFIFGNPRVGTALMQSALTVAIDLPQKILVSRDDAGVTWVSYNDPKWLATRHGLEAGGSQVVHAMADLLGGIAAHAAAVS
jgi:uncharacterized protein (DUF302 family)